ncbi:hypothetical protein BG006_005101 [Podila minutissima]|uniref:Uncharacterized protein n=1 Tax=Podila minutissima TaxID=64525 RepID=A0A9P5SKV1_9FUNG|nr:hypothetical protein BG006_005101 [Podila minutissima]
MPNDGSLDALPLSPCTSGSLGLDHHFLSTVPLKVVENHSTLSLKESHAIQAEEEAIVVEVHEEEDEEEKVDEKEKEGESHTEHVEHERTEHEYEEKHEEEMKEEEQAEEHIEEHVEEHEEEMKEEEQAEEHVEENAEEHTKEHAEEREEKSTHTETAAIKEEDVKKVTHDVHDVVEDLTKRTHKFKVTTVTPPPAAAASASIEKMASGIPERPVKARMPAYSATRELSTASLALKKKQAAESALAATKTMAVEIPVPESISNRIKMFGGSNPGRTVVPVARKIGVRDIVQKYTDVEELRQEEIAHVAKGHEARGVCSAYSLSTASRPVNALRSAPRRKMSHELSEHEIRGIVKATVSGGFSRASEEDRVGVSQESVQSVRNAKSLFENLARSEGAQQ